MLPHAAVDGEDRQDAAGPQEYLGQTSAIILRAETRLWRQEWMWGLLKIGKGSIAYQREYNYYILAPGAVQHDDTAVDAGRGERGCAEQGGRDAAAHKRALVVVVHG